VGRSHSALAAILLGGFIAGTIDIGAACLISGRDVIFILHVIAGGLVGKAAAFSGGTNTAAIGLLLQWGMSIIIAAIYVIASRAIPILARSWLVGGLIYGAGVFFVMNYVVVPLSAYHHVPSFTPTSFAKNMAAMLLFGVIVAFFARERRLPEWSGEGRVASP